MGPSVKFVSAIKDAFFNKKNGGQFFSREKDQTGGSEGGLVKDHTFPEIFFWIPSLTTIIEDIRQGKLVDGRMFNETGQIECSRPSSKAIQSADIEKPTWPLSI